MHWSCSGRWSSLPAMVTRLCPSLAAIWCLAGPAASQPGAEALDLLLMERPEAVLSVTVIGRETAVFPRDIVAIEISDSGGITDMFLRFDGEATKSLSILTEAAVGTPMIVRVCGTVMFEATVEVPIRSGTLYLPNTTAVRAEAVRALWHGRARCDTLGAEVFTDGT
jgi:hypothetical protein